MKIDHLAIWVIDIEKTKNFYTYFFRMNCNDKYVNPEKEFTSYFLSFENGTRIEIMQRTNIPQRGNYTTEITGLAHFAISVGSRDKVNELTEMIRNSGYLIYGEPRVTGDGYYESIVSDPDGNRVEITE